MGRTAFTTPPIAVTVARPVTRTKAIETQFVIAYMLLPLLNVPRLEGGTLVYVVSLLLAERTLDSLVVTASNREDLGWFRGRSVLRLARDICRGRQVISFQNFDSLGKELQDLIGSVHSELKIIHVLHRSAVKFLNIR